MEYRDSSGQNVGQDVMLGVCAETLEMNEQSVHIVQMLQSVVKLLHHGVANVRCEALFVVFAYQIMHGVIDAFQMDLKEDNFTTQMANYSAKVPEFFSENGKL